MDVLFVTVTARPGQSEQELRQGFGALRAAFPEQLGEPFSPVVTEEAQGCWHLHALFEKRAYLPYPEFAAFLDDLGLGIGSLMQAESSKAAEYVRRKAAGEECRDM